jgi:hypothetical protein
MLYQVTLLAIKTGTHNALATVGDWIEKSPCSGKFLACWQAELGVLGQIMLLHGYNDIEAMLQDRETVTQSSDRYGIGDGLANVSTMTYRPFPMFAPLQPGQFGPIFEVRSYLLRVDVLTELTERWEKALPARMALSKPLIIMHSTDGVGPRLMHIWPYASLGTRHRVRAEAVTQGLWPVKGAPGSILTQQSEIFVPGLNSPIR